MITPKHVMHDGYRWRVEKEYPEDGEPWYQLKRFFFGHTQIIYARAFECRPDTHEAKRRIRADGITLVFNVARGLVTIRQGRHRGHELTLPGLYNAVARQAAANLQRERAFKRRTKGRK